MKQKIGYIIYNGAIYRAYDKDYEHPLNSILIDDIPGYWFVKVAQQDETDPSKIQVDPYQITPLLENILEGFRSDIHYKPDFRSVMNMKNKAIINELTKAKRLASLIEEVGFHLGILFNQDSLEMERFELSEGQTGWIYVINLKDNDVDFSGVVPYGTCVERMVLNIYEDIWNNEITPEHVEDLLHRC